MRDTKRDIVKQIVGGSDKMPGAWDLGGWCVPAKALDIYDRLLEASAQFGVPLNCAEVGVYEGKSLFVQAHALRSSSHGGFITGIDPYTVAANVEGFDVSDRDQKRHVDWWSTSAHLDTAERRCRKEIADRGLGTWCELLTMTADDAPLRPLHWLHLDDSHSPTASLRNAQRWVPQVVPGGVVVLDDVHWPTMQPTRNWIKSQLELISEAAEDGMHWEFYRQPG